MAAPEQKMTTAKKATESARTVRSYVKRMYTRAHEAKAEGKPVAWVMFGVHAPILRAMDITPIFTENYAGLCAAKRAEGIFLEKAEALGYANVICGYVRTGLGHSAIRQETGALPEGAPDGGMADPDMLLGCSLGCDPRFKWYEATGRYTDAPIFNYDGIVSQVNCYYDENVIKDYYVKYQADQLHKLIEFLEWRTGKKMDYDRLRECMKLHHETHKMWYEVYRLRRATPGPMPTEDGLNTIVPHMFMPAEESSLEFYRKLRDEVKERVDKGIGVVDNEKYRLLWAGGLPPWHSLGMFNYLEDQGAVCVMETAYYPGKPYQEFPVDTTDPIVEELHRQWEKFWEYNRKARDLGGNMMLAQVMEMIDEYKIDGLVYHATKSCRAATIGQIHQKRIINKLIPMPALFLESDIVDTRDYSEAQTHMKMDAFVETVDAFKRTGAYSSVE